MNYTRRHKRFRLGSQELNGQMTFATEVSILDIGMGGVSLKADKRLNIGGKYMLKLEGHSKVVSVTCEVAWARMSGTKRSTGGESIPVYTAGMKFIGLSPDNVAELVSFVEAIGNSNEMPRVDERRSHSRYPPKVPGIALLDFPADYKVRTISLSGMLIESTEAVPCESRVPMVLSLHEGPDIDFTGRVVSCVPIEGEGGGDHRCHIGIEFIDLTETARDALVTFIAWLATLETTPGQG